MSLIISSIGVYQLVWVLILKTADPAGRYWLWMKNWKDSGQRSGFYRGVDETCRCRRNCSGEIFGRLRNNCREVINPTQLALWCAKTAGKNVKTELAQAGCNLARVVVNVGSVREGGIVHAARLPGVPSSFRTVNYTLTPAIILVHTSPCTPVSETPEFRTSTHSS